ncbi:MAG: sulfotransferase [Gemmatimonadetes bacterium]|nr:sulfotransferase [Gemmatimonadota bacterium]
MFETLLNHPLMGGRASSWLALLARHRFEIDPRYIPRALTVSAVTALLAPLRLLHRVRFGGGSAIVPSRPLFIIGHYRSGTTHLNNLLGCDPQFATMATTQAILPELFRFAAIPRVFRAVLPATRPMDNMAMAPELPEEPEHALGAMSQSCLYHGFCFPRAFHENYRSWVSFESGDQDGERVARWRDQYRVLLAMASGVGGGRPVLAKNPADTGRVPHLLQAFPDARLIFLVRDPVVTYASTLKFYRAMLDDYALQSIDRAALREIVLATGEAMLGAYLQARDAVPAGALVEVRFEDLESNPEGTLARVYSSLDLDGFENARPSFARYLRSQEGYRKNAFDVPTDEVAEVRRRWGPLFHFWGYGSPPARLLERVLVQGDESTGS